MFGTIKDSWKKAEAAAVVESLLEGQQKLMRFSGNPKTKANSIVSTCWERGPHLLNGSKGPRPSRLALAAISISDAIKYEPGQSEDKLYLHLALRELLEGIADFNHELGLNEFDSRLFDIAANVNDQFFEICDRSSG